MKAKLLALIACLLPLLATAGGGFHSGQIPGLVSWWTFNTETKATNAGGLRYWRDVYNAQNKSLVQAPGPSSVGPDGTNYWVLSLNIPPVTFIGDYVFICGGQPCEVVTTNATPVTGGSWSIWMRSPNIAYGPNSRHGYFSMQGDTATGLAVNSRFLYIYEQFSGGITFQIFNVIGPGNGTYIGRTSPTSTMVNNAWYHICCTWDGGITTASQKIYINGVRVDNADASSGIFAVPVQANISLQIGADFNQNMGGNPSDFCLATLDDPRIYNRALTTNEVQLLYGAGYGSQH